MHFTTDAPYEEPEAPELVLATHQVELEDCVAQCIGMKKIIVK